MRRVREVQAQGSMEYLLLIAGVILVAIIVLLLALAFSPFGQQVFNTNLVQYEKIDLCTGQGAECAFTLDWGTGLSTSPYGVVIFNSSDWRTLVVTGVQVSLQCGDHVCTTGDFQNTNAPATSLTVPISNGQCTGLSSSYSLCSFCDISTHLDSNGNSCTPYNTSPISFLSGNVYQNSYTFPMSAQNPPVPLMMTVPFSPNPLSMQKIGIAVARNIAGAVTGVRYNFFVSQLDSANNLQHSSVDASLMLAFHRNASYMISDYSCDLSTGAAVNGCTFGPDCAIQSCFTGVENFPNLQAYCTANGNPQYVCSHRDGSYSTLDTHSPSVCVNSTPETVHAISSTQGVVLRAELPHFTSTQASFVGSLPNGLQFNVHSGPTFEFGNPGQCTDPTSCDQICQSLQPSFSTLQLYDLSMAQGSAACSAFSGASQITLDGPVTMAGDCTPNVSGSCSPSCSANYPIFSTLNSMANAGRDAVIGVKVPAGSPALEMVSSYGFVYGPRIGGAYYSP